MNNKLQRNQEETILPPALLEQKNCKQSWINLFATVLFVPPLLTPQFIFNGVRELLRWLLAPYFIFSGARELLRRFTRPELALRRRSVTTRRFFMANARRFEY
ncbi:MAG: hypothetical protein PHE56_08950 [Bacteroidales bacterium]|nr:hypothetical protein [Bacteroidales bacterium]